MEFRRRSINLRRPVLNELSRSSRSSSDQSGDFILIDEDDFLFNNDRNIINNQSSNSSRRSLPEEEIIKTRGRKKTKCSPFLRDLSPKTLATIKSPTKNSKNEELLKFLRSPTPRKCKLRDASTPPIELKRARKSLIVDLEISNNGKCTPSSPQTTSTPTTSASKKKQSKKTPIVDSTKKKKFFNLRRSTNVKS